MTNRRPLPTDVLAGALQDTVCTVSGSRAGKTLTALIKTREALAAERERSRRLVDALRSMVERWDQHGTRTGTGCCERELRAVLSEYDGEAGEP